MRIVKSERAWDGLLVVLVDRSTDGQMSGKVGNQGPHGTHCREGETRHNASLEGKMDGTQGP